MKPNFFACTPSTPMWGGHGTKKALIGISAAVCIATAAAFGGGAYGGISQAANGIVGPTEGMMDPGSAIIDLATTWPDNDGIDLTGIEFGIDGGNTEHGIIDLSAKFEPVWTVAYINPTHVDPTDRVDPTDTIDLAGANATDVMEPGIIDLTAAVPGRDGIDLAHTESFAPIGRLIIDHGGGSGGIHLTAIVTAANEVPSPLKSNLTAGAIA